MRPGAILFLLAAPLMAAAPARAAVFGVPAVPITQTIDIQPIDVCNNTGKTCASVGLLNAYVAYADLMFQQAGITFVPLPTTKFIPASTDTTNWLSPTISESGSDPFDVAHELMNLPGHGEPAANSTAVLNVWFVNSLTVISGPPAYGTGLIDGNGSIIATAPNPITHLVASIDTLAHELGHNLGLTHVDQPPLNTTSLFSPSNLMYSGDEPGDNPIFRTLPVEFCQIAPYSCAAPQGATVAAQPIKATVTRGGQVLQLASTAGIIPSMFATGPNIPAGDYVVAVSGSTVTLAQSLTATDNTGTPVSFAAPPPTDELSSTAVAGQTKSQIATADNPLYTMALPDIAISPARVAALPACAAGIAAGCGFTLAGTLPPGITLTGYSLSFLGRTDVTGFATAICGGGLAQRSVGVRTISGENEELAFTLAACGGTVTDTIGLRYVNPFTLPISADYDFSNGVASRAGFDGSGDSNSQDPLSVSSVGVPEFPPDTGLPLTNLADTSPEGQTPQQVASFPLPTPSFAAPEPPAVLVVASGFGLLLLARRGRRAGGRTPG